MREVRRLRGERASGVAAAEPEPPQSSATQPLTLFGYAPAASHGSPAGWLVGWHHGFFSIPTWLLASSVLEKAVACCMAHYHDRSLLSLPQMASTSDPLTASELTASWLSRVLRQDIDELEYEAFGEGHGFLGSMVAVRAGSLGRVLLKFPPAEQQMAAIAGFNELLFYGAMLDGHLNDAAWQQHVPRCLYVTRGVSAARSGVIAMGLLPGRMVPLHEGLDFAHTAVALRALARCHATFVTTSVEQREQPPPPFAWLPCAGTNEQLLAQLFHSELANVELRRLLTDRQLEQLHELAVPGRISAEARGRHGKCRTLCHGDLWVNNLLFRDEQGQLEVAIVDWQFVTWSSPMYDVAFLLGANMRTHDRRTMELQLLELYYDELVRHAPQLQTDEWPLSAAIADYRALLLFALLFYIASFPSFGLLLRDDVQSRTSGLVTDVLDDLLRSSPAD